VAVRGTAAAAAAAAAADVFDAVGCESVLQAND